MENAGLEYQFEDANVKRLGIVYFSSTEVTHALADAVGAGAAADGDVEVINHHIYGSEIVEGRFKNDELFQSLQTCDGIVFGSPTYMGGPAAQFKAFADASSHIWTRQDWSGKVAAGFTCGSAPNGDQSSTLMYLITFANQHGMLWVGLDSAFGFVDHGVNRLGCQKGLVAYVDQGDINPKDLETAQYLGQRVVRYLRLLTSAAD